MSAGNPHFQANVIAGGEDDRRSKPMSDEDTVGVRRQQVDHANEHAAAFPHGNAPAVAGHRDSRGRLTLAGMQAALLAGGSVIAPAGRFRGQIVNRVDQLPTEAELAEGDPDAERRAFEAIENQQKELDRQRVALREAQAARQREAEERKADDDKRAKAAGKEGQQGGPVVRESDANAGSSDAAARKREAEASDDDKGDGKAREQPPTPPKGGTGGGVRK